MKLKFKTKDLSDIYVHNVELPTDPEEAMIVDFLLRDLHGYYGVRDFRDSLLKALKGDRKELDGPYAESYSVYASEKETTIAKLFEEIPEDENVLTSVKIPTTELLALVEQLFAYVVAEEEKRKREEKKKPVEKPQTKRKR